MVTISNISFEIKFLPICIDRYHAYTIPQIQRLVDLNASMAEIEEKCIELDYTYQMQVCMQAMSITFSFCAKYMGRHKAKRT